jgi:hypothetical protein
LHRHRADGQHGCHDGIGPQPTRQFPTPRQPKQGAGASADLFECFNIRCQAIALGLANDGWNDSVTVDA